ncbi:unnamed protein product [Musa acuminata subsp. burmannicoides]
MDSANHSPGPDDAAMSTAAEEQFSKCGCCCFWVPCAASRARKSWERIRPPAAERSDGGCPTTRRRWWSRGWKALLKARELSEPVAGPRWKTFVCRFRRRPRHGRRFGYDPMSYALNFDEGQDSDSDGDTVIRGFSARYAVPPASAKSSMDLGDRIDPPFLVEDDD